MDLAPVLKWPGAKWRIADRIIREFPAHEVYVEPFFGSGAVFFRKAPSGIETINDIDGEVVNLFRVIRESPQELCAMVEMTPFSRDEYEQTYDADEDNPLHRARNFLVRTWQAYGGRTRSHPPWAVDRTSKVYRLRYWNMLPERIAATVERLKMAQLEHMDAKELIPQYNNPNTLLYVDPPYLKKARQSGRLFYEFEMHQQNTHLELLKLCLKHRGSCIISSYPNELYDSVLEGWEKQSFQVATNNAGSVTEAIYINPFACREISLF